MRSKLLGELKLWGISEQACERASGHPMHIVLDLEAAHVHFHMHTCAQLSIRLVHLQVHLHSSPFQFDILASHT